MVNAPNNVLIQQEDLRLNPWSKERIKSIVDSSDLEQETLLTQIANKLNNSEKLKNMMHDAKNVFDSKSYTEAMKELSSAFVLPLQVVLKNMGHYDGPLT